MDPGVWQNSRPAAFYKTKTTYISKKNTFKMPRRRLSSDGYKLFNMAYPPDPSRVRELFACFMRSEYDDKLDDMTDKCEKASRQLFAYNTDPIKKHKINKYIDNSIFNIVYAILCKDGEFANKFNIKRNYRYFSDIMMNAFNNGDHNTAILLNQALGHHALKQLKIPLRKSDKAIIKRMEEEYGTWRDCFTNHLKSVMGRPDFDILPSMMVLKMHMERFRQYSAIDRCKIKYEPYHIEGVIGMYGTHNIKSQYDNALPLYEEPPIHNSGELILVAQQAK